MASKKTQLSKTGKGKDFKKKKPAPSGKGATKKPAAKPTARPALKIAVQNKAPVKNIKKPVKGQKEQKPKNLQEFIRDKVLAALDSGKAEDTMCIDVREQSALTDFLIITSGRSTRQVKALSDAVQKTLYECGAKQVRAEGTAAGDWAVIDGGDVIVHIFRPEVRNFYRLEEVWGLEPPLQHVIKDL